ncbi:hypothetical protein FNF27_04638 [Cafeteria roenbergensis]|uniref:Uncharacterized protein n=1 Tax=Cafeteria roenbergensis TaxID=33653 RepID=A0A5A8E832_CAFRO|nr:hypothetical protein FNF29_02833 [Cafeteria roenbergensis]KAA0164501.1 hypothetical protein FNF28_03842 [Cafeteria roenbergensis]KAA0173882.1 hypothetical protein FNF27_04638 [Cafeteria roenbergensis]|eukprot:KAA0153844.1 hypothetical protein FNF29_02833 [Cafeteria roenbergensis]
MAAASACEICIYVMENKAINQPYLCRGLKDPASQKMCVNTLLSTFWWMDNVVYWVNYGCQRVQDGKPQWVKPCPADAMCSWIKQISADENGSTEFCAERAEYIKPQ